MAPQSGDRSVPKGHGWISPPPARPAQITQTETHNYLLTLAAGGAGPARALNPHGRDLGCFPASASSRSLPGDSGRQRWPQPPRARGFCSVCVSTPAVPSFPNRLLQPVTADPGPSALWAGGDVYNHPTTPQSGDGDASTCTRLIQAQEIEPVGVGRKKKKPKFPLFPKREQIPDEEKIPGSSFKRAAVSHKEGKNPNI